MNTRQWRVWYSTAHNTALAWRVVWCSTAHNTALQWIAMWVLHHIALRCNERWCETLHHTTLHCNEGRCEVFTLHNTTLQPRVLKSVVAARIEMAEWMLHGACVGEEAGGGNLEFFRVKWPRPPWKVPCVCSGHGCARSGAYNRFRLCVLQRVVVHLRIALEWLRVCGYSWLPCA